MARFTLARDIKFFEGISRELVDAVIETAVVLYKLIIEDSKTNLYGESLNKTYYQGVQTTAVIEREPTASSPKGIWLAGNSSYSQHCIRCDGQRARQD